MHLFQPGLRIKKSGIFSGELGEDPLFHRKPFVRIDFLFRRVEQVPIQSSGFVDPLQSGRRHSEPDHFVQRLAVQPFVLHVRFPASPRPSRSRFRRPVSTLLASFEGSLHVHRSRDALVPSVFADLVSEPDVFPSIQSPSRPFHDGFAEAACRPHRWLQIRRPTAGPPPSKAYDPTPFSSRSLHFIEIISIEYFTCERNRIGRSLPFRTGARAGSRPELHGIHPGGYEYSQGRGWTVLWRRTSQFAPLRRRFSSKGGLKSRIRSDGVGCVATDRVGKGFCGSRRKEDEEGRKCGRWRDTRERRK